MCSACKRCVGSHQKFRRGKKETPYGHGEKYFASFLTETSFSGHITESTRDHRVCIASAQLNLHFAKCETIHTENSYKFTQQAIRILLEDAGFDVERTWMDGRGWYAVTLARISRKRNQYQDDMCAGSQVSDLAAELPDGPRQPSV